MNTTDNYPMKNKNNFAARNFSAIKKHTMKSYYSFSRRLFNSLVLICSLLLMTGPSAYSQTALQFNGTNQYVTFGVATSTLGSSTFTLEAWIKKTAAGLTVTTGTGGTVAVPVITKGRGEGDTPANLNCNYFLGLTAAGILTADFEDKATGLNHPITGIAVLATNTWYHIAATYDGTTWRLYLNGVLDNSLVVGAYLPENTSIQHAGLATAMTSAGTSGASGYFAGVIDEARIWNVARTQAQIQGSMNSELTSGTGLLGRWGLNDGSGTSAANSIGGSPAGTLTSGPTWVTGAPALAPPATIPTAPSALSATAVSPFQINLSWTDNSGDETDFEIERSTTGIGGTYSLLQTVTANTTTYSSVTLSASSEYCYRVRAINSAGGSGYAGPACATTTAEGDYGLDLGTSSAYVTFGTATGLDVSDFTLEAWIKIEGAGVTTTTSGTGGGGLEGATAAVPIVTKGRGEGESPANVNMNYFMGLVGNKLAADFEEGTGPNHSVIGNATIPSNTWTHVAATYDPLDAVWNLYINGVLDQTLDIGTNIVPANTSIQHAGIGTALTSAGAAAGFFDGKVDEVRIWNYARTISEIQATVNSQILTSQSGLIGRWGLNDLTGTVVNGSAGTSFTGTIVGSGSSWFTPGAPFNLSFVAPSAPTLLSPTDASTGIAIAPTLSWNAAAGAITYQIQVSSVANFATTVYDQSGIAITSAVVSPALLNNTIYYWRVNATNTAGTSAWSSVWSFTTSPIVPGEYALHFGSGGAYVTFGTASGLASQNFTVETWFKKTGAGTPNTTGGSGITIIPLVTKGSPEAEASNVDANYILGIQSGTNVIAADFEEGTGSVSAGLNHPLVGSTVIADNVWHHAAVTFHNGVYSIYLDGVLENTINLTASVYPQGASIQHAALGTMINSTGTAVGKFQGVLDEARVWNYGRTLSEIQSTINSQITTSQAGLLGRWSLDEGSGTTVSGSAGTSFTGTITGTGSSWLTPGRSLQYNISP